MALIVEDGTGKSDAESYISVTDADTYHSARGNTSWTGADTAKEAALRKATAYIDGMYQHRWPGIRVLSTQALSWPRASAADADGYAILVDDVPQGVVHLTAELGLRALTETLTPDLDRGGALRRQKVGPIEQEWEPGASVTTSYTIAVALLARVLQPLGRTVRG